MDLHLFLCFLILSEQPSLKATFLPNSSPSFTFHLSPFALQPIQSEDGGDNPDSVFLQLQGCRLNQTATVSIPIFYNVSPTAEPSWNVPWVGHYKWNMGPLMWCSLKCNAARPAWTGWPHTGAPPRPSPPVRSALCSKEDLSEFKHTQVIAPIKMTFQWFPIALRVKARLFTRI